MINLKITNIDFVDFDGYRKTRSFKQITHVEDNKKLYYVGNTEFTKDAGNAKYLNIVKSCKVFDKYSKEGSFDDKRYINTLEMSKDLYTQYIENRKDQIKAEERNRKIDRMITRIKEVFGIED